MNNKKTELIFSLKSILDYKQSVLQLIDEGKGKDSWDRGNVQREIWKLQEVLYLIESGSQDEEFR